MFCLVVSFVGYVLGWEGVWVVLGRGGGCDVWRVSVVPGGVLFGFVLDVGLGLRVGGELWCAFLLFCIFCVFLILRLSCCVCYFGCSCEGPLCAQHQVLAVGSVGLYIEFDWRT